MSVTVTFDFYSELFSGTTYGRRFLEYPDEVVEGLDNYFDGLSFDFYGVLHPDNVYVNYFREFSNREVLVFITKVLDLDDYIALEERGELKEYILNNIEEIEELLNRNYHLLHWEYDEWYVLEI